MKLENQVVNLELSQQLKEAGYPQEGLWWWWDVVDNKVWKDKPKPLLSSDPKNCYSTKEWENKHIQENYKFVAPTVAELGERLPNKLGDYWLSRKNGDGWCCFNHLGVYMHHWEDTTQSDTEANARAKMWLYLKKEGLL